MTIRTQKVTKITRQVVTGPKTLPPTPGAMIGGLLLVGGGRRGVVVGGWVVKEDKTQEPSALVSPSGQPHLQVSEREAEKCSELLVSLV